MLIQEVSSYFWIDLLSSFLFHLVDLNVISSVFNVWYVPLFYVISPLGSSFNFHVFCCWDEIINHKVLQSDFFGQLSNSVHKILSFSVDFIFDFLFLRYSLLVFGPNFVIFSFLSNKFFLLRWVFLLKIDLLFFFLLQLLLNGKLFSSSFFNFWLLLLKEHFLLHGFFHLLCTLNDFFFHVFKLFEKLLLLLSDFFFFLLFFV